MRILFLTFGDHVISKSGGGVFTKSFLNALRNLNCDLITLSFYDNVLIKNKFARAVFSLFYSLLFRLPLRVSYFYSFVLHIKLLGIILKDKPSILIVDHLEMGYSIPRVLKKNLKIYYLSHNIESVLFRHGYQGRMLYKYSEWCCQYEVFEKKFLSQLVGVFSISDAEADFYKKISDEKLSVLVIPPVFNYDPSANSSNGKKLVFMANLDWWPNRKALDWILNKLLPLLDQSFEIHVYGKGSDKLDCMFPRVFFHGFVNDIECVWEGAFFSLAPIFAGAGVNIKVAESLHNNVPVIGTKLGCEGIEEDFKLGYLVCDQNPELWVKLLKFYQEKNDAYNLLLKEMNYPSHRLIENRLRESLSNG